MEYEQKKTRKNLQNDLEYALTMTRPDAKGNAARNNRQLDKEWTEFISNRVSPSSPITESKWVPITTRTLRIEQEKALKEQSTLELTFDEEIQLYRTHKGIYVPDTLVNRLLLYNHVGLNHPSLESEVKELDRFDFGNIPLKSTIKTLREQCLHCNRKTGLIRRPMGRINYATRPNEVLHLDFLYLTANKYILVITD